MRVPSKDNDEFFFGLLRIHWGKWGRGKTIKATKEWLWWLTQWFKNGEKLETQNK